MTEPWSLLISILAFLFSIISLLLSRHWNDRARNETWKREVRLPYYKELKLLLTELVIHYVLAKKIGGHELHDFGKFINEANTLGLSGISEYLYYIEVSVRMAEGQYKKTGKVQPRILESIEENVVGLARLVHEDVKDLTMPKPSLFHKLRNILSHKSS